MLPVLHLVSPGRAVTTNAIYIAVNSILYIKEILMMKLCTPLYCASREYKVYMQNGNKKEKYQNNEDIKHHLHFHMLQNRSNR